MTYFNVYYGLCFTKGGETAVWLKSFLNRTINKHLKII